MKKFIFSALVLTIFSLNAQSNTSGPDQETCASEAMQFGDLVEALTGGKKRAAYLATDDYYENCMEGVTLILIH